MIPGSRPSLARRARDSAVARILAVYLSAAFVVLQVVDIFTDRLGLPEWFFPATVALLVAGLPIVVTTAVVQGTRRRDELGPEREVVLAEEGRGSAIRRWFTWRRAVAGGVLGFGLLVGAVALTMGLRAAGIGPGASLVAAGVLEERERLIVADFANRSPDSLLGAVVTEALRVDLSQSPTVRLVPDADVREALLRMGRRGSASLPSELAREVAQREGVRAVVEGDVGVAGEGFVLTARVIEPAAGEVLTAVRETAQDSTVVVKAIDRLSAGLRERIGESLRSIRASETLERVTTPSLPALRLYTQALRDFEREGDVQRTIEMLEQAVATDTSFASAWRSLGTALSNVGVRRSDAVRALRQAYVHRDRLTERERYLTIGTYHSLVTRERQQAIRAFRMLLELDPDHVGALNNLGLRYFELGQLREAERLWDRAVRVSPAKAVASWTNLVEVAVLTGGWEAAERQLDRFARAVPGHPLVDVMGVSLALGREDFPEVERRLAALEADATNPFSRLTSLRGRAGLAVWQGRLDEADAYDEELIAAQEELGLAAEALETAALQGTRDVWIRRDRERALRDLDGALERHPPAAMDPLDRPVRELAFLYAAADRPQRARELLADYLRDVPPDLRPAREAWIEHVRGVIAHREGRSEEALGTLRDLGAPRTSRGAGLEHLGLDCPVCAGPDLALAYESAGQPDSARAVYERLLTTRWFGRGWMLENHVVWVSERLGALYAEAGDAERARAAYQRVVDLWKDADPELQPRVEAARREIRALRPLAPPSG